MFNRYIDNFDFKSRFRILKGGKISLVVSALLGSAIIVSAAPTGGVVTSGSATISQNGTTTNIDQTTNKSIINWQNFNVGANETVNFNMPSSSSTSLNRIIGNEASAIYGVINSNGQVFLVNQNGVYFSKTSQVNTAGFVASTKDIKDENFLKGNYVFEGNSNASIINLGTITTPNAYTALLAKKVENEGVIKATLGQIHLASGDKFTLDVNGNSLLKLTIDKGIIDGLVSNKGAVIADGGQIYMTTSALGEVLNGLVNNTGIIQANSIEEKDGKVILFAHGGTGEFGGTIEAKGGFVETSGKKVELKDDIKIKAKKWLIDPYDVEIVSNSVTETSITPSNGTYTAPSDSTKIKASTLMTALNAGIDVTVTTSGSGTQNGDIFVNSAITWNSGNGLTLTADRNIYINSAIDASQDAGGYLVLNYGQASFSGSTSEYYVNAPISLQSGVNFSTQKGTDSNNYKEYTVVNSASELQSINTNNTTLAGNYALGSNVDLSSINNWTPIGNSSTEFAGKFDGLGHTIDKLTILGSNSDRALFGRTSTASEIKNLGLTNVNISGGWTVGSLAAVNRGIISGVYVTGTISAGGYIGGLVGDNYSTGIISNSYTSVNVTGNGSTVGGFVGSSSGTISNSYATGNVNGGENYNIGGFAGALTVGTTTNSYATGNVSGAGSVGGLVGDIRDGAIISNSYATGNVSGGNKIGGLVGDNLSTIQNSYSTGSVTASSGIAGGLVGSNGEASYFSPNDFMCQMDPQMCQSKNGYITNSYSIGVVRGTTKGGLIGLNNAGTITSSYYNSTVNSSGMSDSSYGRTATQLTDSSTYSGWNTNVWSFGADASVAGYQVGISRAYLKSLGKDSGITSTTLFAGGYGTQQNPYTITTAQQLQNMNNSNVVNQSGYYYSLSNNLDLTGVTWTPIGNVNSNFSGKFDGLGYKISNLVMSNNTTDYQGLFGYVAQSGEIKNIGLTDGSITGKDYVGALIGRNYGTITNVYSTLNITGSNYTGGLIGLNYGKVSIAYTKGTTTGNNWVGGLIGMHYTGVLSNTYSVGNVIGNSTVGGLVGYNLLSQVSSSYAIGTVQGVSSIGGLIGADNQGTITSSFFDKTINSNMGDQDSYGKTTAELANSSTYSGWDTNVWSFGADASVAGYQVGISRAYLKSLGKDSGITSTTLFAGGYGTQQNPYTITTAQQLQNMNNSNVVNQSGYYYSLSNNLDLTGVTWTPIGNENSRFAGKFDGLGHQVDKLTITGTSDIQGLFGYTAATAVITNVGVTNANVSGNNNIGALVGYNLGTVSNSYSTGNISGATFVGGLVGHSYFGLVSNNYSTANVGISNYYGGGLVGFNNEGTIKYSYSTGKVIGNGIGGLTYNMGSATVTSSYYDSTVNSSGMSDSQYGKTAAELANSSTYSGWDTNVWSFGSADASVAGYQVGISRAYLTSLGKDSGITPVTLFAGGYGKEMSPYTITTAQQLRNINNMLVLSPDAYYYNLQNNLDLSSISNWTPIGTSTNQFVGIFNGQGHIIDKLTMNSGVHLGLFGFIYKGYISNLGITNVSIVGSNNTIAAGALAAFNYAEIANVYATGNISGGGTDTQYLGGLVGVNNGIIANAYSNVNLSSNANSSVMINGFVGFNDAKGLIKNAYSSGSVSSSSSPKISGFTTGYIENIYDSFWDTQTSGQTADYGVSGIKGFTTAQFLDSSNFLKWDPSVWTFGNESSVEGYQVNLRPYLIGVTQNSDKVTTTLFSGGYGTEQSPYTITTATQLQNINNSKMISSGKYYKLLNNIDLNGITWAPIGYTEGNNGFIGKFDGAGNVVNNLKLNASIDYLGIIGLFGLVGKNSEIKNIGVTNISLTNPVTKPYYKYIGGLVGLNLGSVSNSYTTGSLALENANIPLVGGLVGLNEFGSYINNSYSSVNINIQSSSLLGGITSLNAGTIQNSYYAGTITGTADYKSGIGLNKGGTYISSYYDKTINAGMKDESSYGKTTAELQKIATYDDQNQVLNTDWAITLDETQKKIYPYLTYNAQTGTSSWTIGKYATALNYTLTNAGNDGSIVYNGLDQTLSNSWLSGSIFGNQGSSLVAGTDYKFVYNSNDVTSFKNAGTYNDISVVLLNADYELDSAGTNTLGSFKISKANATVTANSDLTKVYNGQVQSVSGFTANGLVNGETISVLDGVSGASASGKDAGEYVTTLDGTDKNYNLTFVNGKLKIAKADAIVTANSDSKVYNGLTQSVSGFTASGLVNNEDKSVLTELTGASASGKDAGEYVTTLDGTDKNYNLKFVNGKLIISKAKLVVSANDDSIVEGSRVYSGGNGVKYSGLQADDTEKDVNSGLLYEGTSQGAKNVGDYVIAASGLKAKNYDVEYVNGKLVITPDSSKIVSQVQTTTDPVVTPITTTTTNTVNTTNNVLTDIINKGSSVDLLATTTNTSGTTQTSTTSSTTSTSTTSSTTNTTSTTTTVKLKDTGVSAIQLKQNGYTATNLKQEGFTAKDLKDAGYSLNDLKNAGYTADELKQAGFTVLQLKKVGL